ncbi:MAG: hypothetical protein WC877_00655 [Dehalococcoidales bacterium]|jgi:hypothetical protein
MAKRISVFYHLIVHKEGKMYYHTRSNSIFSDDITKAKVYTATGHMKNAIIKNYANNKIWRTNLGDLPVTDFKGLIIAYAIPDPDDLVELY